MAFDVRPFCSGRAKGTLPSSSDSEARARGRNELAQRAEAGYCPRCTRATHIAASARYAAGEFPEEKTRGLSLRAEHGPRAARGYAARLYPQYWSYLPQYWGWAGQSLGINASSASLAIKLVPCARKRQPFP